MQPVKIGLIGFGCVGQGFYYALEQAQLENVSIKKIVVKNPLKERSIASNNFTYDKNEVLHDAEINVLVELIDNAEEAFTIVKTAMENGKHIVTANKKMLAIYLPELLALQKKYQVGLLYEAAVCGAIPIIQTLDRFFANEPLASITGIFNGTTNYVLTKVVQQNTSYEQALLEAQQNGFAETDPTADVQGYDALYKTVIIALHGFGVVLNHKDVLRFGINTLQQNDLKFAKENNYALKLLPTIHETDDSKITAFVLPRFITTSNVLSQVHNELNAVSIYGKVSTQHFYTGKGAGSYPTGAAVLADVAALQNNYTYTYNKLNAKTKIAFTNNAVIKVYISGNNTKYLAQFNFITELETKSNEAFTYKIGTIRITDLKNILEDNDLNSEVFVAVVD
jgi:homoserine dehydrogenase